MIEKYKSRRIRVAIRHVLMAKWDPIGVCGVPEAYDEYDGYLGGVFELLLEHSTRESIAQYLKEIEVARMGLADLAGEPYMPAKQRFAAVDELQRVFHEQMLIA